MILCWKLRKGYTRYSRHYYRIAQDCYNQLLMYCIKEFYCRISDLITFVRCVSWGTAAILYDFVRPGGAPREGALYALGLYVRFLSAIKKFISSKCRFLVKNSIFSTALYTSWEITCFNKRWVSEILFD